MCFFELLQIKPNSWTDLDRADYLYAILVVERNEDVVHVKMHLLVVTFEIFPDRTEIVLKPIYLRRTQFSVNFGCCISKGSFFYRLFRHQIWYFSLIWSGKFY